MEITALGDLDRRITFIIENGKHSYKLVVIFTEDLDREKYLLARGRTQ